MYHISDWKMTSDGVDYEAIISIGENLTPILKIKIFPITFREVYELIIRDYKTSILLFKDNITMTEFDKSFTENKKEKKIIENSINKAVKNILLS